MFCETTKQSKQCISYLCNNKISKLVQSLSKTKQMGLWSLKKAQVDTAIHFAIHCYYF